MEYTVDYFIRKFEAIPEELWCIGRFNQGKKHCAFGHCLSDYPNKGYIVFVDLFERLSIVININDGFHPKYQQPTPKQRILAALNDIKQLQLKTVDEMLSKIMEVQECDATEDESSIEVGSTKI